MQFANRKPALQCSVARHNNINPLHKATLESAAHLSTLDSGINYICLESQGKLQGCKCLMFLDPKTLVEHT